MARNHSGTCGCKVWAPDDIDWTAGDGDRAGREDIADTCNTGYAKRSVSRSRQRSCAEGGCRRRERRRDLVDYTSDSPCEDAVADDGLLLSDVMSGVASTPRPSVVVEGVADVRGFLWVAMWLRAKSRLS